MRLRRHNACVNMNNTANDRNECNVNINTLYYKNQINSTFISNNFFNFF